jgi:hypothetical protein
MNDISGRNPVRMQMRRSPLSLHMIQVYYCDSGCISNGFVGNAPTRLSARIRGGGRCGY